MASGRLVAPAPGMGVPEPPSAAMENGPPEGGPWFEPEGLVPS